MWDDKFGSSGPTQKCYHSHKPLPVGEDKVIYGGNCGTPAVEDADIYVGLDRGSFTPSLKALPWNEGESFLYPITDGTPPKDPAEFMKLIVWLSNQLDAGKKIHVGCIGGHGRTGLVLAALAACRAKAGKLVIPDDDPIMYVRLNYCEKVVETQTQVDFLVEHWGCKPVKPRHHYQTHNPNSYKNTGSKGGSQKSFFSSEKSSSNGKNNIDSGTPQRNQNTIWTSNVRALA